MKIARIVLTATILFSLKSTLFCSSEEKSTDTIQAPRKDSFDALRDGGPLNGWLGWNPDALANYTLENNGQDYKTSGKEVRIGSKNTATAAWTAFGQRITTLAKAQQFMTTVSKSGVQLPEDATQASQSLITAENQRLETLRLAELQRITDERQAQFEQADTSYVQLNQAQKSALQAYFVTATQTRNAEKSAVHHKYEALKKAELTELKARFAQEDTKLVADLTAAFNQLTTIQATQNNAEASNINRQVRRAPFVESADAISKDTLKRIGYRYKNWSAKTKPYAEMVTSSLNDTNNNASLMHTNSSSCSAVATRTASK